MPEAREETLIPSENPVYAVRHHARYRDGLEKLDRRGVRFAGDEILWELIKEESDGCATILFVKRKGQTVHYVSMRTPDGRYHHAEDERQVVALATILLKVYKHIDDEAAA